MPYKSKAERESENWMTLPQVLEHIKSVDALDDVRKAERELRKTLTNGAFYSRHRYLVRWKDKFSISGTLPNEIGPRDVPPQGQEWAQAKVRWASGEVLDPYGAAKDGKWGPAWRIVWLARSKVMDLWPRARTCEAPAAIGGSISTNIVPFKGRKTGPKTDKQNSIAGAMKEDIQKNLLTIAGLEAMSDKELLSRYGDKFDGKRTSCRDARKQVLTEFDGNPNSVE